MLEPERPQILLWQCVACWISMVTHVQAHAHTHELTPACTHTYTPTHRSMQWLLHFHGNSCFVNVPQCYMIHTLPALLSLSGTAKVVPVHIMKALLTSALKRGEWSALYTGCFSFRKRASDIH